MKGDGEDWAVRNFLSLGCSTPSSGEREQICANSSGQQQDHALNLGMLLNLSRNGLSMLAGRGANGGTFSLKPPAAGMPSLHKLAGGERPSAGFTFLTGYRSARLVPKTLPTAMGMGMRFGEMSVKEEAMASSSHRCCSIGDRVDQADVQKLTTDECWRLILKLGTQWPAWNGAAKSSLAIQGLMRENDSTVDVSNYGHPLQNQERLQGKKKPATLPRGQDFLKLLTTKALEALAQTPPDSHRKAGGMLAPKQTTQEEMDFKAAGDTYTKMTEPTPLAEGPSSSREVLCPKPTSTRPRVAALTIFYDGIVNVCDNVPADKARLIMMFAEKAGLSLNAQALLRNVKCVTPSLQPSPQLPTPTATSQEDDLHLKRRSQVASPDETSCVPPSASHGEGSTSDQGPPESSNPAKTAISEPSPNPHKLIVTTPGVNSRRHVIVKPLPNARKNSLARFLDSRKRGTASCSEGGSPKKQALGNECCLKFGCPNDSDHDLKPSLCSESCSNCTQTVSRRATPDAEMRDYFVE